ncbi:MAG: tripartite tricarboxylate transporter substrate binding protein [Betaproteobacteria bacterium]|nr:MAG: tripartite tricarboxylate transporter substrate binding protein [Betaproteobacteria bacterium]
MVRVAAALALALAATTALAQYPSRPIRMLIPQPPGGANDTVARVIAPGLGDALSQPIVIENRPGANGNVAMEIAAKAPADGYTLLLAADAQIVINPHFYRELPFDTLKDLAPVASLINTQMVLAVNPSLPVNTLPEFIEYARRANPPLAYGSIGNGSQHHLVMEMLKQRAGIDLLHVPFKGGGPATTALLAGEIAAAFGGNSVTGHVRAGKLRALAVAGKQRSAAFPDVPRLAEFFPGFEVTPWLALFAPAGVPPTVMSKLREATSRLLAEPAVSERIRRVGGLEPYVSTPEEFAALLRAEYARYGEIVKAVGAKID